MTGPASDAAREADWPFTEDYNGKEQEGFGLAQWTIKNGRRCSASAAFLRPVMRRPNLTVETKALATRVLLEGSHAIGVEYARGLVLVRFDPLGAASGHVIRLVQNPYDTHYTIEVQALTGTIDYHEGVFERAPAEEKDFE